MQHRSLGRTGLQVSRLALGLMGWGTATDEHEARDQLRAFVDAGGSLLDTAHVYGGGASETMLGSFLGHVVSRDDVVVATKAGFGVRRGQRVYDGSRGYLLASLDQSLKRLGVDHVDLWQQHVWDDRTPLEETLSAFDVAVSSGRVRYVGISNYVGWQTAQAATWQRAGAGRTPLASTQMEYSLLNRDLEAEVLPAARALGLGVLPYSPLARGVLTGKYRTGTPSDSRGASETSAMVEQYLDDRSAAVVEAVVRAADGLGWTPLQVALTWVRDRPGVTAPIVGARTTAQLTAALATEKLELPAEIRAALDDVSEVG
ncbi:aldo/keto reductase [Nocardioides sp. SYSU D00038]|uniref:aldo/keto reductase n=1 Tax=Nocardioides sp. SYSU D00038 TaxID=2812554 RepID=UPI001966D476|nr:aldo/keto reductase [Nocardioides sp. SYSU D00038]